MQLLVLLPLLLLVLLLLLLLPISVVVGARYAKLLLAFFNLQPSNIPPALTPLSDCCLTESVCISTRDLCVYIASLKIVWALAAPGTGARHILTPSGNGNGNAVAQLWRVGWGRRINCNHVYVLHGKKVW